MWVTGYRRASIATGVVLSLAAASLIAVMAETSAASAAVSACAPSGGFNNCVSYSSSGADQSFRVPAGVTSISVTLDGAGGGTPVIGGNVGAPGGRTTGTVAVTGGQILTVMVGSAGVIGGGRNYGGGGVGVTGTRFTGGSGGGMSALWSGVANVAANALLIAGGGGGGAPGGVPGAGAGGGASGGSAAPSAFGGTGAGGGTQASGGAGAVGPGNTSGTPQAGSQFQGGDAGLSGSAADGGGGGGGGWFGGGGGTSQASTVGANSDSPAGGGSGYIGGAGVTAASTNAGAGAAPGQPGSVQIQYTTPAPAITSPGDGSTVNSGSVTISGTGAPGATLTVSEGGTTLCTTTVPAGGTFTCPAVVFADGPHTLVAAQSDGAVPDAVYPQSTPVSFVVATNAALTLDKTATPTMVSAAGDTVSYSFVVTNTGNVTLDDLVVTDTFTVPAGPALTVSCPVTTLAPAATTTCTATYTVTQADVDHGRIDNSAVASATSAAGPATSTAATAFVMIEGAGGLTLSKASTTTSITAAGQTVPFTFTVANDGNVTVDNLSVTDTVAAPSNPANLTPVMCPTTTLAPGETTVCTATYTVTQADVDAGSISDSAVAAGTGPDGEPIVTLTASGVTIPVAALPTVSG